MIITRLSGGMGNQMFQYAAGRALAVARDTTLILDTAVQESLAAVGNRFSPRVFRSYALDAFAIDARIASNKDLPLLYRHVSNAFLRLAVAVIRQKFIRRKSGIERSFSFDPQVAQLPDGTYLQGDWQSYKYFASIEPVLRREFAFSRSFPEHITALAQEIDGCNALCVHVRRGDYVAHPLHDVVSLSYYAQAYEVVAKQKEIDRIYVFSDDVQWCRTHISFPVETVYVGDEYVDDRGIGHFMLMRHCAHFIICNSTFSWWAAWLAERSDKCVVAPKRWFGDAAIDTRDLIPPEWIRI